MIIKRLSFPLGYSPAARLCRSAVCVGLCGCYTVAVGAGPSIVRAFLFILINECGSLMPGRRRTATGTFALALLLQLAVHPGVITSVGFQLSYLAMLGITIIYPSLRDWYPGHGGINPLLRIWRGAALSASCQAFTAPLVWWRFRSLPGHFLLTNLLALPLTEFIIVTALATLLLQAAGIPAGLPCHACGRAAEMLEFCLETISTM